MEIEWRFCRESVEFLAYIIGMIKGLLVGIGRNLAKLGINVTDIRHIRMLRDISTNNVVPKRPLFGSCRRVLKP